jgi:thiosulfate/3-mercaptopyruvate sulfurtransferase
LHHSVRQAASGGSTEIPSTPVIPRKEQSMSREDSLVTTSWAEEHLSTPGLVFGEVDEDTAAYDTGHIPGAVKMKWQTELEAPVRRDFVDKAGFEKLLSTKGISNDDTVVLYGGNNNWFAAYA